ncbi:hypothetical protein CORC01_07272 [Colletotrichum orchidophilum]|uniref:Uncharacterized protein n=1 Tax=Colletotrichum orchidophilum TaxID=1209926 RepID=A0A1G4B7Q8_9PEZI|nr:uncharacterized protein CORC01_07272 [Colletotrichum orchidophilum]OHE97490.1 hypothetical protein CORC01_07272 [Colletotrichum orchidophilum]
MVRAASGPIGNFLKAHHRSPSQGSSPLARHYDVLGRWFHGSPHPPVPCSSAATPWLASDSTTLSTTFRHPMPLLCIPCTTEPMNAIPASVQPCQTPLRQLLFVVHIGFQKHERARIWARAFGLPSHSALSQGVSND